MSSKWLVALLVLVGLVLIFSMRHLRVNPEMSIVPPSTESVRYDEETRTLEIALEDTVTLKLLSLIPGPQDKIWFTSTNTAVVGVWPDDLEPGEFPASGSARIIAQATLTPVWTGVAEVCAELHRSPTEEEVERTLHEVVRDPVWGAVLQKRVEENPAFMEYFLARLRGDNIITRECITVVVKGEVETPAETVPSQQT